VTWMRTLLEGNDFLFFCQLFSFSIISLSIFFYYCFLNYQSCVCLCNRHTMSGSILMGETHKGKSTKNGSKSKVDSRLNMGSGILEDKDFDPSNLK
jgi:hypothetical protein